MRVGAWETVAAAGGAGCSGEAVAHDSRYSPKGTERGAMSPIKGSWATSHVTVPTKQTAAIRDAIFPAHGNDLIHTQAR